MIVKRVVKRITKVSFEESIDFPFTALEPHLGMCQLNLAGNDDYRAYFLPLILCLG